MVKAKKPSHATVPLRWGGGGHAKREFSVALFARKAGFGFVVGTREEWGRVEKRRKGGILR